MSTNEEKDGLFSTGQNSLPVDNNFDESQGEEVISVPNTQEPKEIFNTDDLNKDAGQVVDRVVDRVVKQDAEQVVKQDAEQVPEQDMKQDAEQVVKQDTEQFPEQDMKQCELQVPEQEEEHRDGKSTNENIVAAYSTRKAKEESTNEEIVSRRIKDGVEVVSVRNDEDHPNTISGICFNAGADTGHNGAETTKDDCSTSISRKKVKNMKDEHRELLVRNDCAQDVDVVDTHNYDAALCKENELSNSTTDGNVSAIDLSMCPSTRFSAPSTPGAFSVKNPLIESPIHLEMLDPSFSSPSMDNDNNSNPTESYNGILTSAATTATVTLSAPSPMQQSHRDPELGNYRIVQAVCVEDQQVFEAQIIPSDDIQDSKPRGSSSTLYCVIFAVAILASITTLLSVILTRQKSFTESPSPTIAPSISLINVEEMRAILAPLAPGGDDVFNENSAKFSPTRKEALNWLLYEDRLQLPTDVKSFEWKIRQRYVVLLFYFSTNGPQWTEQLEFKHPELDVCSWGAVKSSKDPLKEVAKIDVGGVACNKLNRVEKIRMPFNNLSGTLPHELSEFSNSFIELDVSGGSLSGSIPPSFAKMTLLETFVANNHCLSGTVPDFSNATKMRYFSIYNNPDLSGSLNGFCSGTEVKSTYVQTRESEKLPLKLRADCGGCTEQAQPSIECDCCETCCNEDVFECCHTLTGESKTSFREGFSPSFNKQCLRDASKQYIQENCPCTINPVTKDNDIAGVSKEKYAFVAQCTQDCSEEGAIRYGGW